MELNQIYHGDCMDFFADMKDNSIDLLLTDIPYDGVNRESNGLRKLDKEEADVLTFDLPTFFEQCFRVTKSTIIIFCGHRQISSSYIFFAEKQFAKKGTVRQLIWEKTNPSPMNGENIYLSGIENAIWFKKRGGTFNAFCKNTVFKYPAGRSKMHPTEKNHSLLKQLIIENSNMDDIVFDPCCGSGAHLLVAKENGRKYIGCELKKSYFDMAYNRLTTE